MALINLLVMNDMLREINRNQHENQLKYIMLKSVALFGRGEALDYHHLAFM